MRRIGQVTAFYSYKDFLSNHYRCKFTVHGITFNCLEQFLMYCKAKFFGDMDIARQILEAPHPQDQKILGRKVKGFVRHVWYAKVDAWYVQGLIARYEQNPHDLKLLLGTGDTTLVEAAEHDSIWGVCMKETDDNIQHEWKWRGTNLCGKGQQAAREHFKRQGITHATHVDSRYGASFQAVGSPVH